MYRTWKCGLEFWVLIKGHALWGSDAQWCSCPVYQWWYLPDFCAIILTENTILAAQILAALNNVSLLKVGKIKTCKLPCFRHRHVLLRWAFVRNRVAWPVRTRDFVIPRQPRGQVDVEPKSFRQVLSFRRHWSEIQHLSDSRYVLICTGASRQVPEWKFLTYTRYAQFSAVHFTSTCVWFPYWCGGAALAKWRELFVEITHARA